MSTAAPRSAQQATGEAASTAKLVAGRRASAPRRAVPAVQHVVGNHGALRRPDAAEQEARRTGRRVAAGLVPADAVRGRGRSDRGQPATTSSAPIGGGQPLSSALRAPLEALFDADFGAVRVHLGSEAERYAWERGARAVTLGEHIIFGADAFAPETTEGRARLAHELTHVLQQRASGVVRPQFDDDEAATAAPPGAGAAREAPVYLSVRTSGIVVSSPGRTLDPGQPVQSQVMAIVLQRLLPDYEEGMEDDVIASLPSTVTREGNLASEQLADADQPFGQVTINLTALIQLLRVLRGMGHEAFRFDDAQWRVLFVAEFAGIWYANSPDVRARYPWYQDELFLRHIGMHGALIDEMRTAFIAGQEGDTAAQQRFTEAQDRFGEMLLKPVALLEAIRLDTALAGDEEAGGAWRRIWGDAPEGQPPTEVRDVSLASLLMNFYWRQPEVGPAAVGDREQRVEFMRRFVRWYGRTTPSVSAGDITQQLLERPGEATDPPFPATLQAFPPPHGPARVVPASTDRRFEFGVTFPDVFSAFTHYHYVWDVIEWEAEAGAEQAAIEEVESGTTDAATRTEGVRQSTMGDVVGARLTRDLEYAAADIARIHETFGPAGITVAGALYLNALVLRPIGTLIESFIDLITLSAGPGRRERPVQFPHPGVFVVRVSAVPVVDDVAEIRRPPSVAYLAVFAQDEREYALAQLEEVVRTSAQQDEAREEFTASIRELLAEETDEELRAQLQELLENAERDQDYWRRVTAMRDRLNTRITELDNEIARLQRERPANGAARIEANRAIAVLDAERDRLDTQRDQLTDLINTHTGRVEDYPQLASAQPLYVGFVGDNGQALQLTMEWATVPEAESPLTMQASAPDGSHFVVVSDHTTQNSGIDHGYGPSADAAVVAAVRGILESRFGYGRGEASVRLPSGGTRALRIEADIGAITSEAIENVSLVITIGAVAAAPFTGGASLTILIPIGIIGGGHAAYRMYTRYEASTLRWDLQTALDLVDIVGAAVSVGRLAAAGRAGMRATRFGRVLAVSYEFAEEGTGYIMLGVQLEQQLSSIESNTTMSEGEKRARRLMVLGNAMLQAGIMVGQRVFQQGADELRAARDELSQLETGDAATTADTPEGGTSTATTETPPARETPSGDTPAAETPTAETPTAETPTPETPTAETRVPETPVAEAPVPGTPVAETPTTESRTPEAPTPETPATETLVAETPVAETPTAETPTTETPVAETPTTETPTTERPRTGTPAAETPTTETPAVETPAPEVEPPSAEVTPTPVTPEVARTPEAAPPQSTPAPTPSAEAPRSRAELEQAVAGLLDAEGRFRDADLEQAYQQYRRRGEATRADWAWRTGGDALDRLRSLLGPDFRPPRAASTSSASTPRPVSEASDADLRRRIGDPEASNDLDASAELLRRYGERPIWELVFMVRSRSRWNAHYARQVLEMRGGRRGTVTEYLAEVRNLDALREMARLDPAAADALVERYYREFSPLQLERMAADGDQTAAYVLDHPRTGEAMAAEAEASLTEAVWDQRRTAIEAAEAEAARTTDPDERAAAQARAQAAAAEGTVGAMQTDIPGIGDPVVRGSPRAPTEMDPNQPRHVQPGTDVALAQNHAEEQLLNWLISRIQELRLGPEALAGRTVRIVVDQQVCGYCLSGVASGEHLGVLVQFSQRYPGLRVEITDIRTGDFVVLTRGQRTVHERRAGTVEDR